jgi:hypothetical protein
MTDFSHTKISSFDIKFVWDKYLSEQAAAAQPTTGYSVANSQGLLQERYKFYL